MPSQATLMWNRFWNQVSNKSVSSELLPPPKQMVLVVTVAKMKKEEMDFTISFNSSVCAPVEKNETPKIH